MNCEEKDAVQIKTLKQVLNPILIPAQAQIAIKCNQKPWLKPFMEMSTELHENAMKRLFLKESN